jgi:hypothetical protein
MDLHTDLCPCPGHKNTFFVQTRTLSWHIINKHTQKDKNTKMQYFKKCYTTFYRQSPSTHRVLSTDPFHFSTIHLGFNIFHIFRFFVDTLCPLNSWNYQTCIVQCLLASRWRTMFVGVQPTGYNCQWAWYVFFFSDFFPPLWNLKCLFICLTQFGNFFFLRVWFLREFLN